LPGHNVDCIATYAHWDGRCDRSAVGTTGRAVPRVALLLAALAVRDPRLLYRPLRGRGLLRNLSVFLESQLRMNDSSSHSPSAVGAKAP